MPVFPCGRRSSPQQSALIFRLSQQPLAEASVRFVFGKTYSGLWEYPAAESNLVRAIELQRRHGGLL